MHSAMNINPESELSRRLFESSAEKKPMRLTSGDTISVLQVQAHETIPSTERRYARDSPVAVARCGGLMWPRSKRSCEKPVSRKVQGVRRNGWLTSVLKKVDVLLIEGSKKA